MLHVYLAFQNLRMLKQVLERTVAELAQRFEMTWHISYRARRKRVAVFVSKLDHCLFDILIRHQSGVPHPKASCSWSPVLH
jgi:formyltetrahydrofolate hydrolase